MRLVTLAAQSFLTALSGALMPGPLLTVTIARAPRGGVASAFFLITGHAALELALVVLFFSGFRQVFQLALVRGVIGLAGGAALLWMGSGMLRSTQQAAVEVELAPEEAASSLSIRQLAPLLLIATGVFVSLTNPYFAFWWATVGAAQVVQTAGAWRLADLGWVAFYLGHIAADYGWYLLIGWLVVRGAHRLDPLWHTRLIGVCGLGLLALGVWFIYSGVGFLRAG